MRKRVDDLRVARALKALDEHAEAHPEVFDPDRLPTSPGALSAAPGEPQIGRPRSADPMVRFTCRLPKSMVAAVDEARGKQMTGTVVRQAIERCLKAERRQPQKEISLSSK